MRLGAALAPKMAEWTRTHTAVFIENLKPFTCLWKVTSEEYKNRDKRRIALQNLQEIMKDIVENITIVDVKKKINTIRSQYRREHRLLENSKKSAVATGDVYVPKLWCYNELTFLNEGVCREPRSSLDVHDEEVII